MVLDDPSARAADADDWQSPRLIYSFIHPLTVAATSPSKTKLQDPCNAMQCNGSVAQMLSTHNLPSLTIDTQNQAN